MLSKPEFKESTMNEIISKESPEFSTGRMESVHYIASVDEFMHYLATNNVTLNPDNVIIVLKLADKYDFKVGVLQILSSFAFGINQLYVGIG